MKTMTLRYRLILTCFLVCATGAQAQDGIRLNQIGFYPGAPKVAVVTGATGDAFTVANRSTGETVFTGTLGEEVEWELSGEHVRLADFSAVTAPGEYVITAPGAGTSHGFEVAPQVHRPLATGAIKAFYYQRASTPLLPEHAGEWHRAAGHPDDHVLIHPSAASAERPEGTAISAPRGWYDAGDYNKYIVNSGITMGTLLSLYEDFPEFASALHLNIPESGNDAPDLLDEVLWNFRWMLAMQDPADGGVYNKLTAARFEGSVRPEEARSTRYVIQKSTPATLDFAAVAAQAARVFGEFEGVCPGLADSSLQAALDAWNWARANPELMYNQRRMNEAHDPDVSTGGYGDRTPADEFAWAALELYVTTGADSFLQAVELFPSDELTLPSWPRVETLGYYTILRHASSLPAEASPVVDRARDMVTRYADGLVEAARSSAYGVTMSSGRDFVWGSNSVAANKAIALINAYLAAPRPEYLQVALANLDYLLGRNATGFSFVTGFGDRPTMHPHHRPSESDDVAEPVPGLLAGGPNPGQQDGCAYPSDKPALSYVDDDCSYASNEIAINWNAPLAYLAGAMEALQERAGYASAD